MKKKEFAKGKERDLSSAREWVAVDVGTISDGKGVATGVALHPQVVVSHNLSQTIHSKWSPTCTGIYIIIIY